MVILKHDGLIACIVNVVVIIIVNILLICLNLLNKKEEKPVKIEEINEHDVKTEVQTNENLKQISTEPFNSSTSRVQASTNEPFNSSTSRVQASTSEPFNSSTSRVQASMNKFPFTNSGPLKIIRIVIPTQPVESKPIKVEEIE